MFRAILGVALFGALASGLLVLAPPLTALFTMAGVAGALLLIAALTSAFHRPAEGRDRLLRA